jgi:hypothetical protein
MKDWTQQSKVKDYFNATTCANLLWSVNQNIYVILCISRGPNSVSHYLERPPVGEGGFTLFRATTPVLSMWPSKIKKDEEKSKHVKVLFTSHFTAAGGDAI